MAFSRQQSKLDAIKIKIRQAKRKAVCNQSYIIKHVAEARDANDGKYTLLVKRITEETELKQLRNETFKRKLHELG